MKQNIQNELNEIISLLKQGRDCMAKAAKKYYDMTNKYPDEDIDGYMIRNGVSATELQRLEQVGRGDLHPDLMLESGTIRNRLMDLPETDQERILNQPIPIVKEREGKLITEYKRLPEMNASEKVQSIGVPVTEQRKAIDAARKFQKLKEHSFIANEKGINVFMPGFISWEAVHAAEARALKEAKPVTAKELQEALKANQVLASQSV